MNMFQEHNEDKNNNSLDEIEEKKKTEFMRSARARYLYNRQVIIMLTIPDFTDKERKKGI